MSPLSPQVKENTLDPTHGAAVSAVIEAPLPGKRGTPGVNGGGRGAICVAAGSCRAFSCHFPPPPLVLQPLSFPLSPLGPLSTPTRAISDAKGPHTTRTTATDTRS